MVTLVQWLYRGINESKQMPWHLTFRQQLAARIWKQVALVFTIAKSQRSITDLIHPIYCLKWWNVLVKQRLWKFHLLLNQSCAYVKPSTALQKTMVYCSLLHKNHRATSQSSRGKQGPQEALHSPLAQSRSSALSFQPPKAPGLSGQLLQGLCVVTGKEFLTCSQALL